MQKYLFTTQIINNLDTLTFNEPHFFNEIKTNLPNNAFFVGYITYHHDQNEIWDNFKNKFNSDFKEYLTYLIKSYQEN